MDERVLERLGWGAPFRDAWRERAGQVTATDDVVEVRDGGQVLAGPANDQVETGGHVRTIGYDPRHRVAD